MNSTPSQLPLDIIPGYREAVQRERFVRDTAFMPVTETVAGFELRPLSLRDWMLLRISRNALVTGDTPTPRDLSRFLWLLSPGYGPHAFLAYWRFARRCRCFTPPAPPLLATGKRMMRWHGRTLAAVTAGAEVVSAVRAYLKETLQDAPRGGSGGCHTQYWGDGCEITGALANAYGWGEDYIMDMPLKRVFQHLKRIQAHQEGERAPMFNPSDDVKADWLAACNRRTSK